MTDPVLEYMLILKKEQSNTVLINFCNVFVNDLESKINFLKYARMIVIASRRYDKRTDANEFLKSILCRLEIAKEAELLVEIEIAINLLLSGSVIECGDALTKISEKLFKLQSQEIILFSEFYRAYALYYDRRKDYELFYRYALQYLAYTPESTLESNDKIEWSIKMGMAIFLGRKIYNIGELVEKEILKSLTATDYLWLFDLLQAMNSAKVSDFVKAIEHYKAQIDAVPEIRANMDQIMIKIKILATLDLIFKRQKEDRSIPFAIIAQVSEIKVDEVEWLLMKAMHLGLIKGEIDQVDSMVKITWMKPRVLDTQRIQIIRDTLDKWKGKVQGILKDLEVKTEDLGKP